MSFEKPIVFWVYHRVAYFARISACHAAHAFGALGGLLTGYIFLEARNKNSWIQVGKISLLILVYGASIVFVAYHCYLEASKDSSQICTLSTYERTCQAICYGATNVTRTCNNITICNWNDPFLDANKCFWYNFEFQKRL